MSTDQPAPSLRTVGTTGRLLSDAEMDGLIAEHETLLQTGRLGTGSENAEVRRSSIAFLPFNDQYDWLYRRIWETAQEFNQRFLGADISGMEANIQLARYDSADQGFYNWHADYGHLAANRKISISVQLSGPDDYDGGDLELFFDREPYGVEKERGTLIAFPSYVLHRVAPVTRGTRWSLVAWITGPRWR